MKALQIAARGMMAQQRNTEVVANNLANMNTTGYQRRRTEFSDLIYVDISRKDSVSSKAGEVVPSGVQSGSGVRLASIYRISEQGSLAATGADLFIAECYFLDKKVKFHMNLETLMEHVDEIHPKRMILTHMSEDVLARVESLDLETAEDGKIVEV